MKHGYTILTRNLKLINDKLPVDGRCDIVQKVKDKLIGDYRDNTLQKVTCRLKKMRITIYFLETTAMRLYRRLVKEYLDATEMRREIFAVDYLEITEIILQKITWRLQRLYYRRITQTTEIRFY